MIPVNEPLLEEKDSVYVAECLRTGWISSSGRFINEFEERWAAYCGKRYGITVSNGTTALQLAAACLGLEPGDEVIMPTFTIISCALAVIYNGAIPVLVDSDACSWCMDVTQIEKKITPRTRAIMPVHIYGHPVDMDAVLHVADKHGLAIIEDAAEAHGAECLLGRNTGSSTWRRCGSFGTVSCFSFYANKLITTGEGGMVVDGRRGPRRKGPFAAEPLLSAASSLLSRGDGVQFPFDEPAGGARPRSVRTYGRDRGPETLDGPGIQSAAERLQRPATARRRILGARRLLDVWRRRAEETEMDAAVLARRLERAGVETRPFFLGMHEQPVFHQRGLFLNEHYPVAERLGRQGLYLPSGLALTEKQLSEVCEAVHEVLS